MVFKWISKSNLANKHILDNVWLVIDGMVPKNKKDINRKIVAKLFFRRTGEVYQNWIQAWMISLKKRR